MHRAILQTYFCLLFFCPLVVQSQIYRGSADFTDTTGYRINGGYDSLFIFYSENADKYIEASTLGTPATTIEWYSYNPLTNQYQLLETDAGPVSRMDVTESKGFRVVLSGGGVNDTLRCWALIDDFSIDIINTDSIESEGNWIQTIPTVNKWCHLVRNIKARIDSAGLYYYNPVTGDQIIISGKYPLNRTNWSANPGSGGAGVDHFVQNDDFWLNVDVEYPYWENSWYKLTAHDQFDLERSDSVFNQTIEPHAEFTSAYIHLDNRQYYPDRYDNYYDNYYNSSSYDLVSAPALYKFQNLSINAQVMTWYFGDDLSEVSAADSVLHTYQLPGTYSPMLIVSSTYDHLFDACSDTSEFSDSSIIIPEATILGNDSVNLPNVFSCPDGDNNIFRFTNDASIAYFEIVIYNRYGKRVYHFTGNIRDWEGWDGRDKNSDHYVQTGVYYYVVKEMEVLPDFETGEEVRLEYYFPSKVLGADGKKKSVPSIYQGFVHVYNTE
jgi:hypothetical protein